ncbi:C6 zinc finger domain containing protein [Colletotrichum tofieldiae]|uniref:C6 zinc finger domain containing protein n=1 Tax=Colletotrichum tofieldiae TaxID=708197 RepID=A0A166ZD99_9PEZI|nr:C6 zinc finger domain containing protein [Colletotrichum tofieldiae]GKT55962.1 C6 zinc finger domain containing protein [Colletotrichum tofieldiae]GKT79204.1 C6 zinc finger domain containing protein [Colletotrichum tofieldiae]
MKLLGTAAFICALLSSSARAASYTEALISLHKTLVEADSTTKTEALGTQALKTYLETNFTVELQTVEGNRQNVYAYPGNGRKARVLLTSHIDTVPPYIPYSRIGDEIWGRGTSDAKGSVAAQITAVETLLESGEISEGDVSLLFVVGEESSGDGMRAANKLNLTWDSVIFGEPTENNLVRAHKGVLGFNITADGVAGHSGYPEYGRSAIDLLVRALEKLQETALPSTEEFGNTTLNVGYIEGGIASNVIAESAAGRASIRAATGDLEGIKDILNKAVSEVTPEYVNLTFTGQGLPVSLDYDVEGFNTTVVNYYTDVPHLNGTHKRYLYGPGTILVAHSAEERITVSDLELAVEGYKTLILESLKE